MKILTTALLVMTSSVFSLSLSAAPVELDSIAVTVNNGVILQSDINNEITLLKASAEEKAQALPDDNVLRDQVSEQLVLKTLQEQQAQKLGISIDDNRLNDALQSIAKDNNKTLQQFIDSLEKAGVNYSDFREKIRSEIAASEAKNAIVRRRISILPAEVDSMVKLLNEQSGATSEYHISHIQLLVENGSPTPAQEQLAKQLVTDLKNGKPFSTLAISYSKGPKALQGGDWGWMRKEEMPTIFADQITASVKKGDIIGPFKSGVGLHILKITDVKGLESVAVTEVNARHILLKTSVILSDDGAKKELERLRKDILSGKTTFAALAKKYSEDKGSASRGGELGYQTPDIYVPAFKQALESLSAGQISHPFKSQHGWHIVEVLGKRRVDKTEDAQKNKAYRILFNRKFNDESATWLQELKAGAFIEYAKDTNND